MKCQKCGRRLLKPSASGFGPVCERAVLGPRKRKSERQVKRDTKTRDLFEGAINVG